MSWLGRVWGAVVGREAPAERVREVVVRANYDAAGDQKENRGHWGWSNALSANALNGPSARSLLRNRARYEVRNNGYAKGLVSTLAQDLVGTGPRLQLKVPGSDADAARALARRVEADWRAWCDAADLPDKLRLMHEARVRDGECFGLLIDNPKVNHPVKLDLRPVESDQVETPLGMYDLTRGVGADAYLRVIDGVEFDDAGNAAAYYVSPRHPGDLLPLGGYILDFVRTPAANVLHWFRPDRPGQARGVSELAPALNLFAQLRRYTLATVLNAEFAATVAGVMTTEFAPPDGGEPVSVSAATEIPLAPGSLLTLPAGCDAKGFEGKQPPQPYSDFKHEILAEAGRGPGAPRNLTSGDSSQFNFASGRLDHLPYQRSVWIERRRMGCLLARLFAAWWAEYALVPEAAGGAPAGLPPLADCTADWQWDGFASLDPVKEATATQMRLADGLTTLAIECAAEGTDWEEVLEQRFVEAARVKELEAKYGVQLAPPKPATDVKPPEPGDATADDAPANRLNGFHRNGRGGRN